MADGASIERIDAVSRDICRLFAEGDRVALLAIVTASVAEYNNYEIALITAMAVARLAPGQRQVFINFLTGLCGLLNSKAG